MVLMDRTVIEESFYVGVTCNSHWCISGLLFAAISQCEVVCSGSTRGVITSGGGFSNVHDRKSTVTLSRDRNDRIQCVTNICG